MNRSGGESGPSAAPSRVYINGRFLSQRTEGVQRTAEEIVRALDGLFARGMLAGSEPRPLILAPPGVRRPDLEVIGVREVGRLQGHAWEQLELPWHARRQLLVNFCNAAPLLKRRQIATLHDAAVFAAPAAYSRTFATWYRGMFRILGRTAAAVLTVSDFSRRELIAHAGIPARKVTIVRQGAQHLARLDADGSVLVRHGLEDRPYLLMVGSRNPNKNVDAVLEAVATLADHRARLVVVGGANDRVFRTLPRGRRGEADRILPVGYVSDSQLKALYEGAAAFVFPSVYEGFGLPPLEAMACGCATAVADIPVLREVCGAAAEYFDPGDPAAIARVLDRLLADDAHRRRLQMRGTARARQFTWEACARQVWETVEGLAARPDAPNG